MGNRKIAQSIAGYIEGKCILIIEPSSNYRTSMKGFFSNLRISSLDFVHNVRDARISLFTKDIGLIICEWKLQNTNGIQFCREIREQAKHVNTPFLLITAENLRKDVVLASEVRIDGYLLKPFSFEQFSETLFTVLKSVNDPSPTHDLINKGMEYLRSDQLAQAENFFTDAIKTNSRSARAFSCLAIIAEKREETDKAVGLYKRALEINSSYIEAIRALINIFLFNGPTRDLITYAEMAHKMSPDNPKYSLILAKAYLEDDMIDESETYFKKTIRQSPKVAEAYKGLGKINLVKEDYDSAMRNFEKALDLDGNDASVLNSLGLTYVRQNQIEKGIIKYHAALRISPRDYRIMFNLAYAFEKAGEADKAISYYSQCLSISPSFDKAQRRIDALRKVGSKDAS